MTSSTSRNGTRDFEIATKILPGRLKKEGVVSLESSFLWLRKIVGSSGFVSKRGDSNLVLSDLWHLSLDTYWSICTREGVWQSSLKNPKHILTHLETEISLNDSERTKPGKPVRSKEAHSSKPSVASGTPSSHQDLHGLATDGAILRTEKEAPNRWCFNRGFMLLYLCQLYVGLCCFWQVLNYTGDEMRFFPQRRPFVNVWSAMFDRHSQKHYRKTTCFQTNALFCLWFRSGKLRLLASRSVSETTQRSWWSERMRQGQSYISRSY